MAKKKLTKQDRRTIYECSINLFKKRGWMRGDLFGNKDGETLYVELDADYSNDLYTLKGIQKAGVEPGSYCLLGAASWCAGKELGDSDLPELKSACSKASARIEGDEFMSIGALIPTFNDEIARNKKDIFKVLRDAIKILDES